MKTKSIMTCLGLSLICLFLSFKTGAQVIMTHQEGGTHKFISGHTVAKKHFYLFGDGYCSGNKSPKHEYTDDHSTAVARVYVIEPYDDTDIDDVELGSPDSTVFSAQRQIQDFHNKVAMETSWNVVFAKENYFVLMFENMEDTVAISGELEWHYKDTEISVEPDSILDNYGNGWVSNRKTDASDYVAEGFTHKIIWTFDTLAPDEQRYVYIPGQCLKGVDDTITTRGIMKKTGEGYIAYNPLQDGNLNSIDDAKIFTMSRKVRAYAHDPNCIVTNPEYLSTANTIQTVFYDIYFQNEGEGPVDSVRIDFRNSGSIDDLTLHSFRDSCRLEITPYGWDIIFENIDLPGTQQVPAVHYDSTISSVTLKIDYDLGQFTHPYAYSAAQIYFDSLSPVLAENTIYRLPPEQMPHIGDDGTGTISSLQELKGESVIDGKTEFSVYPNPCQSDVYIAPPHNNATYSVSILNYTGERLVNFYGLNGPQRIRLSDYPPGMYLFEILFEQEVRLFKVTRQP